MGPAPAAGEEDPDLINAGKQAVTLRPGGSYFHQADSFAMIRGGHLDLALLGGYQVSAAGDLANWNLPGPKPPAVGGAMDLVRGARSVWVLLSDHCARDGSPRIVERCTLPLTGAACVRRIYSNLAVIEVTAEGLRVTDLARGVSLEELQALTGAPLERSEVCGELVGAEA
jgi:3-oxoacid CoA-transferase subunit B